MRLNAPKCQPAEMGFYLGFYWSGCRDLNSGPSVPQCNTSRVRPVVGRHESCDSGLLSATGADYDDVVLKGL